MEETLFTKIIQGKIPSHKIYEDDQTYAFLDIYPAVPGYTLVVPKRQVVNIWDLEESEYVALMLTARKVGQRLRKVMPQERVGVKIEGLEVPHAHVKLFPFDTTDEFNRTADTSIEPDHENLTKIAEKLRF